MNLQKCLLAFILLIALFLFFQNTREGRAETEAHFFTKTAAPGEGVEEQPVNQKILVELFLAPERKSDLEQIKRELEAAQIRRIRTQFFKLGNPPENIAIGKNVPASVARLAIKLAKTYNRDIKYLLPEYRFFPEHIVIGSSAFDEKSQIPITPDDLEKLSDPSLGTDAFHALYRRLTGEDTRLPKYTD